MTEPFDPDRIADGILTIIENTEGYVGKTRRIVIRAYLARFAPEPVIAPEMEAALADVAELIMADPEAVAAIEAANDRG